MKAKKFNPFDIRKKKKTLTRKELKHLYQMALIEESNYNAEIQSDYEKF